MKVRLRIDGTDRTTLLPRTGWSIDDYEGKSINTLKLELDDRLATLAQADLEMKDVILDNPDTAAKYFRGLITEVDTSPWQGIGLKHSLLIQGYEWLLERYVHTTTYTNQTDAAIISNAFTNCNLGLGLTEINATTYVATGRTIEKFVMNSMTLRQLLEALAEITGFIWYVDWDKNLVYRAANASVASFSLSDAPDQSASFAYQNMVRSKDYTGLVTVVRVRGGFFMPAAADQTLDSDGVKTVVFSGKIRTGATDGTMPSVWVNTGTEGTPIWTSRTVGNADAGDTTAGFQCVFSGLNSTVEFAVAPPAFSNSYKLNGRTWQPFVKDIPDDSLITAAGNRHLYRVIQDESIKTDEAATDKAMAVFREAGSARDKMTLSCDKDGLRSGMSITVVNAKMSINKIYSIRRVVTRFIGNSLASYELLLTNPARRVPDVIDMIAAGYRASMPQIGPREEKLVLALSFTETTAVSLADTVLEAFGTTKTYRVWANPISLYRFEEGQGSQIDDRYGSNHLTTFGAPAWEQGKQGYALHGDGAADYARKVTFTGLSASVITICGWVKLDTLRDYNGIAGHKQSTNGGWWFSVDVSGQITFKVQSGGVEYVASKTGLSAATWYHVAGVYDAANVKVYVDGVVGTDAALVAAVLSNSGDVYVMRDGSAGSMLDGLLDEFYIFPTALSVTEIQRLRDFKQVWAGFMKVAA